MVMRKKGQWVFIGIMVFIMVFIALVQFIEPLKDQIIDARDSNSLDCGNNSISTGQKMSCIVVDTTLFYFLGAGIAAGAGYLTSRGVKYKFSPPNQ